MCADKSVCVFNRCNRSPCVQTRMFVCSIDIAEQEQNKELAKRYNANKDDFPVYKLFVQGRSEPIDYTGNKKSSDEIIRFIVGESGNYCNTNKYDCFVHILGGIRPHYVFIWICLKFTENHPSEGPHRILGGNAIFKRCFKIVCRS